MTEAVPVTLVSGFLGAGKTTHIVDVLLRRSPGGTVVVLNELGRGDSETSLFRDFELEVLPGGCACCEQRDELRALLRRLVGRARSTPLAHVIIELTGVAHPERVAGLLLEDPLLRHRANLREVVVVADAPALRHSLAAHAETAAQLAAADRVVLSKTDLCACAGVSDALALVRQLNPDALVDGLAAGAVPQLLDEPPPLPVGLGPHVSDVQTVTLDFARPLNWQVFGTWLTMLVHAHGQRLLRFKARIDAGGEGPVLLDAVQHVVHQPRHLESWSEGSPSSTMTFISRGLDAARMRESLETFERVFAPLASDPGAVSECPQ